MRLLERWKPLATLLLASASFCTPIAAQTSDGEIAITVNDASGAVVPGAAVTITGAEMGNKIRTLQTNERGLASAPLLPPGIYDIVVSAAGFKNAVRRGIVLRVGQVTALTIELETGSMSESVTVVGQTSLLEEKSGTLAQVVEKLQILSLPLNGRNYLDLAKLSPGAIPAIGSRDQTFSAYGLSGMQNSFLLDGARNVNYLRGQDNRARDMVRPPLDALNEFTVQTSNYSAQFGAAAGGVVNAVTKSGTNQVHGSAYDFLRNDHLDAVNFFAPSGSKPLLVQNQYGGSLGAPLKKDRAWIFAAYEGEHIRSEATSTSLVPTTAQRSGNFGATPVYDPSSTVPNPNGSGFVRTQFPSNGIPVSRFNSIGKGIIDRYPLPNTGSFFANNLPQLQGVKNGVVRGDVQISSHDTLFTRYSVNRTTINASAALPPPAQTPVNRTINSDGIGAGYTRSFGPTLVNEFRFSWTRILMSQDALLPYQEIIPGTLDPRVKTSIPTFGVTGFPTIGAQPECCGNDPLTKSSGVWDFSDNVSKQIGAHMLKFGADYLLIRPSTFAALNGRGSFGFTGVFTQNPLSRPGTGSPAADLLMGTANTLTTGTAAEAVERGWYAGGYLLDEWTISRSFTLTLGLRYELFSPYIETQNRMANLVLDSGSPLYGQFILAGDSRLPRSLLTIDQNNFAPRVGFAWRVPKARDFVVRGSFGIFYAQDQGNGVSVRITSNPPFYGYGGASIVSDQVNPVTGFVLGSGSAPRNTPINPADFKLNPAATTGLISYAGRSTVPYIEEWNLTVEKRLPWNIVWETSYVGNVGVRLWGRYNANQPLTNGPGSPTTRRPLAAITVAAINRYEPWNMSNYEGLSTKLDKRLSSGVNFLTSFTYGHAIDSQNQVLDVCDGCGGGDTVQDAHNRRAQRSSSDNDIRARWVVGGLWQLPFGRGKRWAPNGAAAAVAGGWELSAIYAIQTGPPLTAVLSFDNANAGTVSYPNRICDGNIGGGPLNRYFDTNCFVAPPQYVFGNSGRNVLRGSGLNNIDLSVHREFRLPIEHATTISFRAEAFNAVNHPQFGNPGVTVGTASFGVITGTSVANRQLQLALRLAF
jgi:hypothetical protein